MGIMENGHALFLKAEAANEAGYKKLSSVSIVFPAYNEQENIEQVAINALEIFSQYFEKVEVLPVNDGSADNTGEIINRLATMYPEVRPLHHQQNQGYGGALKTGLLSAKHDYVFFSDSDGQFDLREITRLLEYIEDFDIVVGFRARRADPFHRKLNAFCWGNLVRLLFGIQIRDIDCAFKLFRRHAIDNLRIEARGAMINTEILAQAGLMNYRVKEVPVSHYPRVAGRQTGANPVVILKAFVELFKLHGKLKARVYKHAASKV